MEASRRTKYLNALGVTQYRRRSLSVVHVQTEDVEQNQPQATLEHIKDTKVAPVSDLKSDAASKPAGKISDIFSKASSKNEANELVEELEKVHDDLSRSIDRQNPENSQTAFGFDLFVWRAEQVLVLEFSQAESEDTSLKHMLTNNILRALWPQNFNGVELHQHSWPMRGVSSDISSATEWLNSLVAGHINQQSGNEGSIPIWVMGEAGLKMLFPEMFVVEQAEQTDLPTEALGSAKLPTDSAKLIGTSIHHEKLGVELIISPSLKQISESAVAKAQVWQLLKPIR